MSDHIKPPYDVALPKITPEVYEAYGGNVHLIRPDNNDWSVVAVDFAVEIVRPAVQDRIDTLESQRAQTTALLNAGAERINTLEAAELERDDIRREEWAKAREHFELSHRQVMAQLQATAEYGAVLVNRIAQLEAALREHGRHKQHCALLDYHDERAVDCTCGLSAVLAGEPK